MDIKQIIGLLFFDVDYDCESHRPLYFSFQIYHNFHSGNIKMESKILEFIVLSIQSETILNV